VARALSDPFKTAPHRVGSVDHMAPTFNAIGLVVSDMSTALAFYRRLGLSIPPEADKEPHVNYELPGGLTLMWDTIETIRSFDASWAPPTGGHRVGLAFVCADAAEVDRTYADMVAAGYGGHKEPWDAFWGQRYAVLHDPDGNSVELCTPFS
jgi:catechol 2,3-dioxygenase-like lactoylglutathione lyase family enzyme